MKKVLIIDDEINDRELFRGSIASANFTAVEACNGHEGINALKKERVSVALIDLKLPDIDGIELMKELKKIDPAVPVIIVTAHVDVSSAVTAIKQGAYDFISKPTDFDDLVLVLKRAVEKYELEKEVKRLYSVVDTSFGRLLGNSEAAKKLIKDVQQVARSDLSIIIQGETGTGKSTLAREIHAFSERAAKPFIKVDIGALTETLIESELFGHVKGAFTGADREKKGLLEIGAGGTIFIDEIQNMSHLTQSKLLNAVEEKTIWPVGGSNTVQMDIRIITATNVDMEKLVMENKIRKDLYYRLSEFVISIPPLRERVEDIRFFALRCFEKAGDELNKPLKEISNEALDILTRYSWPGNIRELKNVIRKAVLFSDRGVVKGEHIKTITGKGNIKEGLSQDLPLKEALKLHEKNLIKHALELAKGNKSGAARILQTSYRNLLTKINEYKL